MKAHLEKYLWEEMQRNGHGDPFPRDVINVMIQKGMIDSPKPAWRTLEKWENKCLYEYGSVLDLGWKKLENKK